MRITALEEHLVTRGLLDAWGSAPGEPEDQNVATNSRGAAGERLLDLGDRRLADMDDQGIDVQVLSLTQPGVQNLTPDRAIPLAQEANDLIAATIATHPDRFQGLATLPTSAPDAAAAELRRTVQELGFLGAMIYGRTGARNVDHPDYEPLWTAAAHLRAPIYLHPQRPQAGVRDAYYSGLGTQVDFALSSVAIGWHYETGLQLLRMIFGGVFDRHPDLQVIVGHWGELVLFWEERFTSMQRFGALPPGRTVLDYFRQHVSFTGSGDTSDRYLAWTKEVVGVDRILYATDYPFIDTGNGRARSFLMDSALTDAEKEAVAHGNWERLTAHLR